MNHANPKECPFSREFTQSHLGVTGSFMVSSRVRVGSVIACSGGCTWGLVRLGSHVFTLALSFGSPKGEDVGFIRVDLGTLERVFGVGVCIGLLVLAYGFAWVHSWGRRRSRDRVGLCRCAYGSIASSWVHYVAQDLVWISVVHNGGLSVSLSYLAFILRDRERVATMTCVVCVQLLWCVFVQELLGQLVCLCMPVYSLCCAFVMQIFVHGCPRMLSDLRSGLSVGQSNIYHGPKRMTKMKRYNVPFDPNA